MLTSLKANPKQLLMNTSKKGEATEVALALALALNPHSNAQDLKTGPHGTEGTTGIEVMMTAEATDEVEVVVDRTSDLVVVGHIMVTEADTAVVAEEAIMTDVIIVVEEEV